MKTKSAFSAVTMKWLAVFTGMLCLSIATITSAEEAARPCRDDATKICKGVKKGEGRIMKCLKKHENEVSPACKENIAKAKEAIKEAKESCEGDAKKICTDVKPGGGRIVECLKQHEGELSSACKAEMGKPRSKDKK